MTRDIIHASCEMRLVRRFVLARFLSPSVVRLVPSWARWRPAAQL